jgi:hypothetical protein
VHQGASGTDIVEMRPQDESPRTMVYLSLGLQRPMTRKAGHNASNSCLLIVPSGRSTRSLNTGPVSTRSDVLACTLGPRSEPLLRAPVALPPLAYAPCSTSYGTSVLFSLRFWTSKRSQEYNLSHATGTRRRQGVQDLPLLQPPVHLRG